MRNQVTKIQKVPNLLPKCNLMACKARKLKKKTQIISNSLVTQNLNLRILDTYKLFDPQILNTLRYSRWISDKGH